MTPVVWDAGRKVRGSLNREHPVRVALQCRCGRGLGFLFGTTDRPTTHYSNGSVPRTIVSNRPTNFRHYPLSPKCRADWQPSVETLRAAYRRAAAKPPGERILVFPYDLEPVPRGQATVGLDRPLVSR
jgi:hypothetical protein